MLRKARKSDVKTLAQIHSNELSTEFLPSLGIEFLIKLYRDFVVSDGVDIIVFENRDRVCGFIIGAKDFSRVFKKIIINNFFSYLYLITRKLITKPRMIKKVFETFLYTNKEETGFTSELIVIAVSNDFHRKGIGRKLIIELEKKFKKKQIKEYKVSVNKKNKRANTFYKSLGFVKIREFSLYNKRINLLTKNI